MLIKQDNELNLSYRLHEKYGELMRLDEVAVELKFPTADAVRKSLSRGVLSLTVVRLPNRRGSFIKTNEVVEFLQKIN